VWIHLLLKANWKDSEYLGCHIPRGSGVFGRASLARDTGLSQRAIRTACQRLKSTNEITTRSTSRFTVYTIVKYDEYQNQQNKTTSGTTSGTTSKRPANDQQTTTSEESKKERILMPKAEKIQLSAEGWNGSVNTRLKFWKETYPGIDVDVELKRAAAWALANPKNRKSNWERFLNNWLRNAQDRARPNQNESLFPKGPPREQ
jgi:hypothetical protein